VPSLTQADVDRLERPIAEFLATLTKRDFYEGVVARGILGYPASTVEDIYADPHLEARRFWQMARVATSASRDFPLPGGFAVVDGERLPLRYPAPRVGEHDGEVLGQLRSRSPALESGLKPAPR
jgi:crotonobetainyl-CoA:carnitine CoA-transferase CaiB-like acyl-CoA transferase